MVAGVRLWAQRSCVHARRHSDGRPIVARRESSVYRTRIARTFVSIAVAVGFGLAFAGPASAASDAPAGNNGSIKVDNVLIDDGNENVAHPGCTFVVDFFGYDVGHRTASLVFEGQEPTGGGELLVVPFEFDVASRDSGSQLDASKTIDLSDALVGIAPQPNQGWRVELTVHVDGAKGADSKHKVFWVSECAAPALVAAQEAVNAEAAAAQLATDTAAWTAAEQSFLAAQAAAAQSAQLAASRAAAQTAAADAQLPRTGAATGTLLTLALGLIVLGGLLLVPSKRYRATSV